MFPTKIRFALSGEYNRSTKARIVQTVTVLKVATSNAEVVEANEIDATSLNDIDNIWDFDSIGIRPKESDLDSFHALEQVNESI